MLQAVLFLSLCPLLVTQQLLAAVVTSGAPQTSVPAATPDAPQSVPELVTIPKGTTVELLLLDSVSPTTSKSGDAIRWAVSKDVVVNGIAVIHAGTSVSGVVTKVSKPVRNKRGGRIEFRPTVVEISSLHNLRFTDVPSEPISDRLLHVITWPMVIPYYAVIGGYFIGTLFYKPAYLKNNEQLKENLRDEEYRGCLMGRSMFTKSTIIIRVVDLPAAAPINEAYDICMCGHT
jgi:hypothetical protein